MDNKENKKYLRERNRFFQRLRPHIIKSSVIFIVIIIVSCLFMQLLLIRYPKYGESNTEIIKTTINDFRIEKLPSGRRIRRSKRVFVQGEVNEFYCNPKIFNMEENELSELLNEFISEGSEVEILCVPPREILPNPVEDGRYEILRLKEGETVYVDHLDKANENAKEFRTVFMIFPTIIIVVFLGVTIGFPIHDYRWNVLIHKRKK